MKSCILPLVKVLAKILGTVNYHQNVEKYTKRWWLNVIYKFFVFLIINLMNGLYLPMQFHLFHDSSQIVSGKIFIECSLNWARISVPYLFLIYYEHEIENLLKKCGNLGIDFRKLNKILWYKVLFYLFLTILKLSYYSRGIIQGSEKLKQNLAVVGYLITGFVVEFTNLAFITGLNLLTSQIQKVNECLKNLHAKFREYEFSPPCTHYTDSKTDSEFHVCQIFDRSLSISSILLIFFSIKYK